jgi:uncharacterized protein YkwD
MASLAQDALFDTGRAKRRIRRFAKLIPPATHLPTFSKKENLMLSTIVVCAATVFCAASPAAASQPGKTEQKLELLAIEQNIVDNTNAERARYGLPALVVDANLMATARQHCAWMATYRQLVHTNIGVAENIAMGQPSSQEVVRCWMNSSGHRANILNGGHRRIGVAAFRTPEGTIYWCQQFTP